MTLFIAVALRPHLVARLAREKLERVLTGYYLSDEDIESSLDVMLTSIHNKLLPALEVEEALSVLRGKYISVPGASVSPTHVHIL